ncbi:uncharacterized protein rab44 [Larimichthys crocea]|uniref:uncharacterized protein rab44 n=1 Tax=Larimichthys crocea TaxID=215358 RepID=UPI000F5DC7FC|nr:uncharacterized protein LOC104931324 [Larimichthys crocea]
MLVAIEKTNQEESSPESYDVVPAKDDNSLHSAIMSDYSSEVQNSNTTNYPETDMECLIPKSENLQEDHDEEVKATHELDHSPESVTQVATEDAEIISGSLIDQAEISDTYQFEFIVKGTDDSVAKQEDLNTDDKQDVHPTKENSIEALEQTNEDEDTEKLQINDTETADSALGQVYEGEASVVEDDIQPSVEQTVHQEKEGILSGDEESESSLQTQQSETNALLDSQPQQNDTDFNSIGSRRKLGSSRRNKGRHRVKESVAESYLRPTEEVVESVSDNEALETTEMLVAIEKTNQEESSPESEHDVVVPATDDNSLYSAIMSDYSSEVQSSNTTNYPETDMESLIPKSENLQEDHDERETDFKVEVSDKSVEATLEEMDQSDTLQSQEDGGTYHSEDSVDKVHEQEVNPTHELDHSPESVTQVATEDTEIISGSLIEQAEISDTYQFEFIVKGTDDSADKQEDLNTDNKQDVHPTKENSIEASEQTNEDEDTEKLQTSDTERVDSALGHVYEGEASVVEDDIKPSVDQTVHQEKEGILSGDEESESSLQTQQSETNALLDSQPQQNDTDFNSIGSRRKLGSSRRNKGRHRVKESVAEVVESVSDNEALETTQMLVAIEKTNQVESSPESEHDVVVPAKDDNSLYSAIMSDYSSEVQKSNTTNYPETDMESLIPKSENLQEDHDERETDFKVEVSDKSVEATLEEMDQSDTLQSQEDRGTYHSEDGVDKVHEQEVNPTHELDHSPESVTQVATEDAEIISGSLIDQAEISDTYQFEFIVKGTDDSAAKQEDLNTDDKQDVHPTKENSIEASEQTNEDEDTEKLQTSDTERVDSALGHVYEGEASVVEDDIKPSVDQTVHQEKEGILSGDEESESSLQTQQSETNALLDSQPQQNDTDFNSIGSRRKLGSSRRNKGRHRVKESVAESYLRPTEEVVEIVSDSEALETTQMLVAIEKTNQKESSPESCDVVVPATDDTSLYSAIMSHYSSEVQSSNTANYPETDMESVIPKSENLQEDHDERETDFKVEVSDKSVEATLEEMDQSDTLQSQEDRGTYHSEDGVDKVHEQEVNPTHELDHSPESVTQVATEDAEVISGNLTEQAEISDIYQFEFIVKGTDDSAAKQEDLNTDDKQDVHPTKENRIEASEQTNEDEDTEKLQISDTERVDSALGHVYEDESKVVEDDIKPSVEQTVHQEKEGLNSEVEESEPSSQTLQSGTNAYLDSQPEQNDTNFIPIGSRRKLGSSRRNRGRRHAKDPVAESNDSPAEEIVGNIRDNDQTEGISDQVKENEHVGALVGISEFMSSSVHPNLTVDQQVIDLSNSTEMPEQDLSIVYSVKEKESKDGDEDTDLLRQDGNSQGNYLVSELHLKLPKIESSTTPEISTEKSSTGEHADIECVKEAAVSSPEEFSANEEQRHVNFSQVRGSLHSENAHMQEMHQIDFSSINESLQSEMNALLNSQDNSQDNSARMEEETDLNPTGNRRKLGSSRRNKGRQQVKVSVAKTYHEPKDEFVENARGDEANLETTKMLLATDTTEEFKQQTNLDLKPVNNKENTEKMLEDTILSQNVMDNSTTTDVTSSSGKDDSLELNKDVEEHENFSQFTGNNTVKIDLMQSSEEDSYIQNISNHDDNVTTRPVTMDVLEQEEACLVQNREALSSDKDSWQQIDDAIETMGYVIKDYNTEVASSVDVQVFRQDEVGENFADHTKKDHEAQEINISQGITHAEQFSAAQTNIGTLAPFDIGLKENRAETVVDVPKESGISCNQQQGIQEKTDLDNSENLQGKSKQKRRKMGSTRRTQLNREPEEGMGNEDENKESDSNMADMKFDRMEVVELPVIVTADVHQNGNTKLSPVDKEQQGTNVINTVQDLALTFLPPVDPTKENNFEALEQTNEEQQISGIERVDTALGQVYVIEGQVEDDIKPSVFSEEESNSSLQTLQSGTNATLDSQPEQNDTNFKPIESRRKLGSSRRNKGRHHAKDSEQQGTNEISTVQDLALMALPPEQSTVDVEPSQPDDFTSTEMHVPSVPAGTNTTNAGITGESFVSSYETTQSAQNDEKRLESVNLRQDQALKSAEADLEMMKSIVRGGAEDEHKDDQANIQELNDVNEGAHNTNLEMKNSSPNLNSPGRRRKMGSTRRNLGSRSKREDLHEQQEVENRTEATETLPNVGDVKSASFQSIEEKEELQPLTEDKEIDPEQRKEKVFETVEYSHAFESHVKPPPHQEIEENPVSHVQLVETDHLTPRDLPAIPSTSPTAGGRRRKLGSSRKLRGHQTEGEDTITDTQNRRDVRSITEESDIKTTEEDSLGLDKISEVDESDKEPPSNISASKEEELSSQPVSEETPQQVTPVTSTYAEIHLSQESQKTFSLAGSPKGAALKSNSYNVMMVGDSSVGKSSFMKRAQSGKFSLDLPSSVGLDSCKWTVLVDGKPVVLHLWDTAGQERFHSITRQIFHKAQAFLLMYDITSTQSFSAVSYWADCIQEGAAENVTILLLGNKNDMAERKVKTEEGANLARECNFEFMECSAATGENVIHSLETVARMLSQKVDTREETTVLQKESQQKKSGCC